MAAPNLATLFDFETQFEKAAQTILQTSGINAFISRQTDTLPLINTGVSFSCDAAIDELTYLPLAPGQTQPVEQEYFRYTGQLELRIEVERDTQTPPNQTGLFSFFGQMRGLIRAAFMRSQWPFYDGNLPYYRVWNIRPNGSTQGLDQVRNVDSMILRFEVSFAIQPSAWPAGFPPT